MSVVARRESFERRRKAAAPAVERVLRKAGHAEVGEMVARVWFRAWRGYERALAKDEKERNPRREAAWVAWFVRIAVNVSNDEWRDRKGMGDALGKRVAWGRIEMFEAASGDEASAPVPSVPLYVYRWEKRRWEAALADERSTGVEEWAAWLRTREALRQCLNELPVEERLWGKWGKTLKVARKLGLPETTVRRRRTDGLKAARAWLERRGYTSETRGREPGMSEWWPMRLRARGKAKDQEEVLQPAA